MTHANDSTLHNVYVIELDNEVLKFDEFIGANPQYKEGMPCVFVGETRHSPKKRFHYHLVGYKSHEYVRRYARRLAPEYYASMNPVNGDQAKAEAQRLADTLRARGFAVWQHENALDSQRSHRRAVRVEHHTWHHHFAGA